MNQVSTQYSKNEVVLYEPPSQVALLWYKTSLLFERALKTWEVTPHASITQVYCELRLDHLFYQHRFEFEYEPESDDQLKIVEVIQKLSKESQKWFLEFAHLQCQFLLENNEDRRFLRGQMQELKFSDKSQWVDIFGLGSIFAKAFASDRKYIEEAYYEEWEDRTEFLQLGKTLSLPERESGSASLPQGEKECGSAWPLPGACAFSDVNYSFQEQLPFIAYISYYVRKLLPGNTQKELLLTEAQELIQYKAQLIGIKRKIAKLERKDLWNLYEDHFTALKKNTKETQNDIRKALKKNEISSNKLSDIKQSVSKLNNKIEYLSSDQCLIIADVSSHDFLDPCHVNLPSKDLCYESHFRENQLPPQTKNLTLLI